MAAPAFYVDWDTNGTNQVVVTGGHATDGFVTNEVPTSAELNKWMNGVGLWVRYFAALFTATVTLNLPPSLAVSTGWVMANSSGAWQDSGTTGTDLMWGLPIPVGCTLTSWSIFVNKASSLGQNISAVLDQNNINTIGGSQVGGTQTSGAAPGYVTLGATGVNHVVTATDSLLLRIFEASGQNNDIVLGAQIKYTQPV